jgi:hypothetical protein
MELTYHAFESALRDKRYLFIMENISAEDFHLSSDAESWMDAFFVSLRKTSNKRNNAALEKNNLREIGAILMQQDAFRKAYIKAPRSQAYLLPFEYMTVRQEEYLKGFDSFSYPKYSVAIFSFLDRSERVKLIEHYAGQGLLDDFVRKMHAAHAPSFWTMFANAAKLMFYRTLETLWEAGALYWDVLKVVFCTFSAVAILSVLVSAALMLPYFALSLIPLASTASAAAALSSIIVSSFSVALVSGVYAALSPVLLLANWVFPSIFLAWGAFSTSVNAVRTTNDEGNLADITIANLDEALRNFSDSDVSESQEALRGKGFFETISDTSVSLITGKPNLSKRSKDALQTFSIFTKENAVDEAYGSEEALVQTV